MGQYLRLVNGLKLLLCLLLAASVSCAYSNEMEMDTDDETHPVMVCKSNYYDKTTEVPLYSDKALEQTISLADYLKKMPSVIYVAIPRNQYGIRIDDPVILLPLNKVENPANEQVSYIGFINGVGTTIISKNYPQTVTTTLSNISFNLSWPAGIAGKKLKSVSAKLEIGTSAKTDRFQGKPTTITDATLTCFLVTKKDLKRYPSLK